MYANLPAPRQWAWFPEYANLRAPREGPQCPGGLTARREPLGARTRGRAGDRLPARWSMLVPVFVLGPSPRHARLTMEVEDSGGVVLTAYHSYARSQQPSGEQRCASRSAASHPLIR
ncbi:hypothetical protein GHT09_008321 [Marmota monax]|uniref:Uncharacterized protein n=1 Tax=Marmota monax TaxID=9995 RepID=A0A834QQS1_MARMO|nr:hypothetical protein GHT09_008321 [Marmota monax]